MAPAWNTRSPTLKPLTSRPTARTVPTASQPRMRQLPAAGRADARTFVSTGLTAMASTATSRSFGPGSGSGSSMSTSERSSEMGRGWLKPMAFMDVLLAEGIGMSAMLIHTITSRKNAHESHIVSKNILSVRADAIIPALLAAPARQGGMAVSRLLQVCRQSKRPQAASPLGSASSRTTARRAPLVSFPWQEHRTPDSTVPPAVRWKPH